MSELNAETMRVNRTVIGPAEWIDRSVERAMELFDHLCAGHNMGFREAAEVAVEYVAKEARRVTRIDGSGDGDER